MRRKSQTESEIPSIGIKVQRFFGFVLPTSIPRFMFLHVCSLNLFLFQVFW